MAKDNPEIIFEGCMQIGYTFAETFSHMTATSTHFLIDKCLCLQGFVMDSCSFVELSLVMSTISMPVLTLTSLSLG
jgi:1,2-phenylacetyl-CoA epoxidase catalytic subunit